MFTKIFLIIYLLFLPAMVLLLTFIAAKRYPNFSVLTHWISNLGEKSSRSFWFFSIPVFLLGVFNVIFGFILWRHMPLTFFSTLVVSVFTVMGGSTAMVAVFPGDRKQIAHIISGTVLFLSAPVFSSMMLSIVIFTDWFGPIEAVFAIELIIILFFSSVFLLSWIIMQKKFGFKRTRDFVEIRKTEKSFIYKNTTLWEWLMFLSSVLFLFSIGWHILLETLLVK